MHYNATVFIRHNRHYTEVLQSYRDAVTRRPRLQSQCDPIEQFTSIDDAGGPIRRIGEVSLVASHDEVGSGSQRAIDELCIARIG